MHNKEGAKKRQSTANQRHPITLGMLQLLKALIRQLDITPADKGLIWSVCTMAFAGAFRIHELLSKTEAVFDPAYTLLTDDITCSTDTKGKTTLHVHLKCPKETKSLAPTVVDIFESGNSTCPVKAFNRWRNLGGHRAGTPLFRWKSGSPLTGKKFNNLIKYLLSPYIDKSKGKFVTHSFRIGLASTLGALGFGDDDIKAAGRWSSRAFEMYIKLARTKRAKMGKIISRL